MLWNLFMKPSNLVCQTKTLLVGSRASKLALKQVEEVFEALRFHHRGIRFSVRCKATKGDKDLQTSLKHLESTNFFTEELDEWVLSQKVRVAIHSAKDLPDPLPKGLKIVAITQCLDSKDVLVFRKNLPSQNREALKIGVSSLRREKEIQSLYPKASVIDLRGTIEARLKRLQENDLDALVMAKVALIRLGYKEYETQELLGKTPPLQGSLAVVALEEDHEMQKLFACIDYRQNEKSLYFGLDPARFLTRGPIEHCPLIEIKPLKLSKENLRRLDESAYLLLTSQTSLKILFELFKKDPLRLELLKKKRVIAIGHATRQFALDQGLSVDYLSLKDSQEGLIDLFSQIPLTLHSQIFYPKSTQARALLLNFLKCHHPQVKVCDLYETLPIKPQKIPSLKDYQELVFTSSSVVKSFFQIYKDIPEHLRLVFKGSPSEEVFIQKSSSLKKACKSFI